MRDPRPVKIWLQILLGIIPFGWIFALLNIGKLRIGLAIFFGSGFALGVFFGWLGFPPYTGLALSIILWVILVYKWSVNWNKQFTNSS